MANFTLKIRFSKLLSIYYCDDRHYNGGIDIKQRNAFIHLVGDSFINEFRSQMLFDMAELHGWKVEVEQDIE